MQYLSDELLGIVDQNELFGSIAALEGVVYRNVANRKTFRFENDNQGYFAKIHYGVGWREIFKNLLTLRLPVLGADREWDALNRLHQIGIDTMQAVAFTYEGWNPAAIRSCIVTKELANTLSLEELFENGPVRPSFKRQLIDQVADISRRLHDNGVNHRDYYICHFLMKNDKSNDPKLYLIDLHRAQMRKRTPVRWIIKDVGGLFFSIFDLDFTQRDLFRFIKIYSGKPIRRSLSEDKIFWQGVLDRARQLYLQDNSSVPKWVDRLGRDGR